MSESCEGRYFIIPGSYLQTASEKAEEASKIASAKAQQTVVHRQLLESIQDTARPYHNALSFAAFEIYSRGDAKAERLRMGHYNAKWWYSRNEGMDNFGVKFKIKKGSVALKEARVEFKNYFGYRLVYDDKAINRVRNNKKPRLLTVGLLFEDMLMKSLCLRGKDMYPIHIKGFSSDPAVEDFVVKFGSSKIKALNLIVNEMDNNFDLRLSLADQPAIRFVTGWGLKAEFLYSAEKNLFQRKAVKDPRYYQQEGASLEERISAETYLAILTSILKMIPLQAV